MNDKLGINDEHLRRFDYWKVGNWRMAFAPLPDQSKTMNAPKYILYRYMSGRPMYLCDFHDAKYGHITRSGLESKAIRFEAADALEKATKSEWLIKRIA
jgi:hypothetical protein